MSKTGNVFYRDKLAGRVSEGDYGYQFVYNPAYLAEQTTQPISLTLPLREDPYYSKTLFPFFDGLIPEGWLLDIAQEHWKVKSNDRFELLMVSCRDTIGAVTIIPENV
ncbi:MAG: HipA N-terminal domain-containing protein [Chitinophagaceae bacterium]|nr:HipA N-terminal domain-containing protein [Chitinophagaceae bacterium]